MQAPDDVVFIATDGITSLRPLDVEVGSDLGQWEAYTADEAVVAQSGVYWLRMGKKWKQTYRGFDQGTLRREHVAEALEKGDEYVLATQTRFVTMGRALVSDESWHEWRRWITKPKKLRLTPLATKRELAGPNAGIRRTRPVCPVEASAKLPSALFPIEWIDGREAMPEAYKNADMARWDHLE
jgi:hypothetical protein